MTDTPWSEPPAPHVLREYAFLADGQRGVLGQGSQRAAIRVAHAVSSFAPAPLQEDMAMVLVQVPVAAPKVAS